jgi:outer membrane lipoprotein SlyB
MSTQAHSTLTTETAQRRALGSHWMLAAVAAGLVAAGAIGGGLLSHHMNAQAAQVEPKVGGALPLGQALQAPPAPTESTGPARRSQQPSALKAPASHAHTAKGNPSATATATATAAAICQDCGVVESVVAEKRKGEGSGVGAVAGGVIGGLIGNQMGDGNGRKAMTVLGAVGGGLAGHEVEKHQRASTVYVTQVRMQDGSRRTFTRSAALPVGQAVTVQGNSLRIAASAT